jgi:HSP20 family protein
MLTYYVSPRRRLANRLSRLNDSRFSDVHIPVDVAKDGEEFVITALLPGISAEDVSIEILEDTVSISGEFPVEANEDFRYLLRELPSGNFSRVLRLPHLLDKDSASAEVKDGVLSLRVLQAEETKAKQIEVKAK